MDVDALSHLAAELTAARAAAEAHVGVPPLGIRAVDTSPGRRRYLCAFPGAAFLCMDEAHRPATQREEVRRVASCALLVEHGEGAIDGPELTMFATLAGRVARVAGDADLGATLHGLATAAMALNAWREAPERAIASLASLEDAIAMHDRLRVGFERFVEQSDPLVATQDSLPGELVDALREFELAAGRVALSRPLASALAEAIGAIDAGAEEIADGHVTTLAPDDAPDTSGAGSTGTR